MNPKRHVSIRELARELGVSIATVSKVLNDVPDSRISAQTASRVRELAERLHFVASAPARELRLRRAHRVGVVVTDLTPFTVEIIEAIEQEALRAGYTAVLACSRDDSDLERQHLQMGLASRVDGLIVLPSHGNANQILYVTLLKRGVPVVFVSRYLLDVPADYVGVENERGAYAATQYLIAHGARRIGFVGGSPVSSLEERQAGYRRAISEAGLPVFDLSGYVRPHDFHRALTVGQTPIDGVLWSSYIYLQRRFVAMLQEGLDPPTELLFTGFDSLHISVSNAEEYRVAQRLMRPLPTIIQPAAEMGRRAMGQILTRLGGDLSERVHLELPVSFFGIGPQAPTAVSSDASPTPSP